MIMSPADEPIIFVTGVDAGYFPQLFLLMGSLRRYCPDLALHVCDFGLSPQQQEYLRRKNMLLERPDDLPPPRFVWDDKAALGRYVAPLGAETIVWIDCDTIVVSDLKTQVLALAGELRKAGLVLAAPAGRTVDEVVRPDVSPVSAELLKKFDPKSPFFSAGFFVVRSAAFLKAWEMLCRRLPLEQIYEQYAFMMTAFVDKRFKVLDSAKWNVSDKSLMALQLEDSPGGKARLLLDGTETILVHLTSSDRRRDLVRFEQSFVLGDRALHWHFRLAQHPGLLQFQTEMIQSAIVEDFPLLAETNVAELANERKLG